MGVKEAVKIALKYINDLYDREELYDLRLEEVELSDSEDRWFVTLGFTRLMTDPTLTPIELTMRGEKTAMRVYKVFEIEAETGEVISMKIRDPLTSGALNW